MRRFSDRPVRQKLVLIVMLASGGALLAANAGLFIFDLFRSRNDLVRDLQSLAEVVAQNSTAALSFDDAKAAGETLGALRAKPAVVAARIYRAKGEQFADYFRGEIRRDLPSRPQPDGPHFSPGALAVYRPIVLHGERVGTVCLVASLDEMYGHLRLQATTVTVVLLASAAVSLLLSARLQRVISDPIMQLADTAKTVSQKQDYSLRAARRSDDELGQLVDAFNQMLAQIEDRDRELQKAKQELEQRVDERTLQLQQELAERRRAEEELAERNALLDQSNRELDDFAYIASHDLKEPLRGIHNFSVFLLEDYNAKLDADGKAKLETLVRLTRRMETLIDSLLHFSRVGRVDLAIDRVDLNPIVAAVLDSLSINLEDRGVEVRIPRPLPTIRCDQARVGEIFRNLISNAIKYNDKEAGRWVEIGCRDGSDGSDGSDSSDSSAAAAGHGPRAAAGRPPVFYVRDNGIGIPAKHYDAIFRIFKRLHGRDHYGGGTGAGLTIVKKIVERHSGRIWVESEPAQGTTFYFTLEKEQTP